MRAHIIIGAVAFLFAKNAFAATYYVDYASGADSNDGASKASAWRNAPGMAGCAASCATHTLGAGDHVVFKGGVTWPASALPLAIAHGGSTNDPVHYGVDPTWFAGNAWARPVFDDGGAASTLFVSFDADNAVVDDIEMTGLRWSSSGKQVAYVWFGEHVNVTVSNAYLHGWSHTSSASDDLDVFASALYGGAPWAEKQLVLGCTIGGPSASGPDTDAGMAWHGGGVVRNTVVRNMPNGFLPTAQNAEISHNAIGPIVYSFSGRHENAIEDNHVAGTLEVFGNVIHDTVSGVSAIFVGGYDNTVYVYDNLLYATPSPPPITLETRGYSENAYVYNNTIVAVGSQPCVATVTGATSVAVKLLELRNNHCISEGPLSNGSYLGTPLVTNNLVQTHAQSATAGYDLLHAYAPMSSSAPTVDQGVSLANVFGDDLSGVARPQGAAWDIGAYEYCAAGCAAVDAGPVLDAGGDAADANVDGTPPDTPSAGCACASAGSSSGGATSPLVLLLLVFVSGIRRRLRPDEP
jgi:MYXO-CTERM domain-containing protein